MVQARTHDRQLVRLLDGVYAFGELDDFRRGVLHVLLDVVPSAYASYNEVGDAPEDLWAVAVPEVPPDLVARWAAHASEHPVLEHIRRTRDGRPRRISDFLAPEAFRALALHREFYGPLGLASQVALTLPSRPPVVVGLALSRGEEDFSDAEVALLAAARPHLIQAYRAIELAAAREATIAALAGGLEAAGQAVLVVDEHGRVAVATAPARRLLRDVLGLGGPLARLPAALQEALAAHRTAGAGGPLVVAGPDGGSLALRRLGGPEAGTELLVLAGGSGGMSVEALRGLGLTPRQAEALRWIALGRTAPEAARLMGASPRTVHKHLQQAYAKLGVRSRSQASATAWAAVGLGGL